MSDKRQRARVQGSWAKPLHKPQQPTAQDVQSVSGSWKYGPRSFEFHQPADPIREIPAEKLIENAGDYEISQGPTGVSRLRLIPGFLQQEEADWMFSKLVAELPWSQKTNYRMMGDAYEEPRLTCWYGELPYTYSRSTMQANAQWHPVLTTLCLAIEEKSGHTFNSLLCNLYRDGKDSIGWHSDSEPSLGPQPVIASLSLGDTKVFSLRKQPLPVSLPISCYGLNEGNSSVWVHSILELRLIIIEPVCRLWLAAVVNRREALSASCGYMLKTFI
uniref:AlkB homolog 3, alpha-ketoglutarate-dependent dioxygenase n=1 Tax=Cyprinus carpio TaxID=7962 RepID=A0A8C2IH48_CYPCA